MGGSIPTAPRCYGSPLSAEHLKRSHTYQSNHKAVEAHLTRTQAQGVSPRRDRGASLGSMGVRHGGIIDVSELRVTPRRGKGKRKGKASKLCGTRGKQKEPFSSARGKAKLDRASAWQLIGIGTLSRLLPNGWSGGSRSGQYFARMVPFLHHLQAGPGFLCLSER